MARLPNVIGMEFVHMGERYAIGIVLEGNIFQLCHPFSLQPFIAFVIPTEFGRISHLAIDSNMLLVYSHRHMMLIELDSDVIGIDSMFADANLNIVNEARLNIKPAYPYPKKGFLNKVHTIQEAVNNFEKKVNQ